MQTERATAMHTTMSMGSTPIRMTMTMITITAMRRRIPTHRA